MSESIRVQKAIARAGLMSRRAAEDAVRGGRVMINERTATLGDRVDLREDSVWLDGGPIPVRPDLETHLLNKPIGVISTASDPQGRTTVVDLVGSKTRLFPVGRLDSDSEGLILVSNDGDLANLVTHPSHGVPKTYLMVVAGSMGRRAVKTLTQGVVLDDGPAKALAARVVDTQPGRTMVEVVMGEGRNREIRRMAAVLGYEVVRLVRTAIGPISDSQLKPGDSRRLTASEVWQLGQAARS